MSFFNHLLKFFKKWRRFGRRPPFVLGSKLEQNRKDQADANPSLDRDLVTRLASRRLPTVKQIRHLPRVLSKKEKLALLILGAVVLVVSAVWFIGGYFERREAARGGGEYIEALVGYPRNINPILAQTDADLDITKLVYANLFSWNGETYVPDLAETYSLSADQKTYTVKLREHLRWHDGKPITADDVIFTVETAKNPKVKSPLIKKFSTITIEKVDERTVNFILKEPFSLFISWLAVGILPEHLWADVAPESMALAELNLKPVGSGPFRFNSFIREKRGSIRSYILKRNNSYHGEKPRLQKIVFKFFPDFESAAEALWEHGVNGISYLPPALSGKLNDKKNFDIHYLDLPQYSAVFLNGKTNELLRFKEIRRALVLAIDRETLVKNVFKDGAKTAVSAIASGFPGASGEIKNDSFDLAAAEKILDDAGWKRVSATSVVRLKKSQELKIVLTNVDQPTNMAAGEFIKAAWEAAGFRVDLKTVPFSQIQKDVIRSRNYEALLFGEAFGGEADLYPFWHSSQTQDPGLNIALWNDRETDKLLEEARATSSSEERTKKYSVIQNKLIEETAVIFLWHPKYLYVTTDRLKVKIPERIVEPQDRFAFISSWTIKSFAK